MRCLNCGQALAYLPDRNLMAALQQGDDGLWRYEGPGGPTSFDSYHDSTGIFQIDTYSTTGAVQVTGNISAAQLRALS